MAQEGRYNPVWTMCLRVARNNGWIAYGKNDDFNEFTKDSEEWERGAIELLAERIEQDAVTTEAAKIIQFFPTNAAALFCNEARTTIEISLITGTNRSKRHKPRSEHRILD
jgi:hypothetical protein